MIFCKSCQICTKHPRRLFLAQINGTWNISSHSEIVEGFREKRAFGTRAIICAWFQNYSNKRTLKSSELSSENYLLIVWQKHCRQSKQGRPSWAHPRSLSTSLLSLKTGKTWDGDISTSCEATYHSSAMISTVFSLTIQPPLVRSPAWGIREAAVFTEVV